MIIVLCISGRCCYIFVMNIIGKVKLNFSLVYFDLFFIFYSLLYVHIFSLTSHSVISFLLQFESFHLYPVCLYFPILSSPFFPLEYVPSVNHQFFLLFLGSCTFPFIFVLDSVYFLVLIYSCFLFCVLSQLNVSMYFIFLVLAFCCNTQYCFSSFLTYSLFLQASQLLSVRFFSCYIS